MAASISTDLFQDQNKKIQFFKTPDKQNLILIKFAVSRICSRNQCLQTKKAELRCSQATGYPKLKDPWLSVPELLQVWLGLDHCIKI